MPEKLHILLVADGRSPITRRWVEVLNDLEYRITLVSTYPFNGAFPVEETFILPVAFSQFAGTGDQGGMSVQAKPESWRTRFIRRFRPLFLGLRYRLAPLSLGLARRRFIKIVRSVQPDLVHALRIPYEGMLARFTPPEFPLIVSVWGNDFTLHAAKTRRMGKLTRAVCQRADAMLADVERDINLSRQWGFERQKPALVVPGGGGIDLELIRFAEEQVASEVSLPQGAPVIINPRGIRAYALTDTFFQAIPRVLQQVPNACFVCTAMAGKHEALAWVKKLNIEKNVILLPSLPQLQLWNLFHRAQISVSLTSHDGTPNTLIEAMACRCFPIAGDIEALREWITPGVNGFLVELHKPQALSEAILMAIKNPELRETAAGINRSRIQQKGEVNWVKSRLHDFYHLVGAPQVDGNAPSENG